MTPVRSTQDVPSGDGRGIPTVGAASSACSPRSIENPSRIVRVGVARERSGRVPRHRGASTPAPAPTDAVRPGPRNREGTC